MAWWGVSTASLLPLDHWLAHHHSIELWIWAYSLLETISN